jgi:hypothetical protein
MASGTVNGIVHGNEVLVFTLPEAMPRHDHTAPEPAIVIVETGDRLTLVGDEELLDHRPAMVIEVCRDAGPVGLHAAAGSLGGIEKNSWDSIFGRIAYWYRQA